MSQFRPPVPQKRPSATGPSAACSLRLRVVGLEAVRFGTSQTDAGDRGFVIENFETVKKQLLELAEVLNSFKSEAVQLRIVDLVLGGSAPLEPATPTRQSRKGRARKPGAGDVEDATVASTRQRTTAAKPGALATLTRLLGEGFFKTGKTIGDIVKYCETTLALPYKQSDFSGKLVRLVRDKKLTREKNAEGQYEYKQS